MESQLQSPAVRRILTAGVVLLGAACTCGKPGSGLEVEITFTGFRPACLEVQVSDEGDPGRTASAAVAVTAARPHVVGIARAQGWSPRWQVTVLAREGSCQGPVVAGETRAGIEVPEGAVARATFALSGTDADGDGYSPQSAGGTDCDDQSAQRSPGLPETCADGLDNDCDGLLDCGDPGCAGAGCDDGSGCSTNDTCSAGSCAGAPLDCGPPALPCRQSAGACTADAGCSWPLEAVGSPCDGGACNSAGLCAPADSELDCGNGIDDATDADLLADCQDPDCFSIQAPCDAGLCVVGATCRPDFSCTGAPKTCLPNRQCRDAGTCDPGTGACTNPQSPVGSPCDDGDPCTDDTCTSNGMCQGAAKVCTSPTLCATSSCDAGACVLAPANTGASCDDDAGCTHSDVCAGGACGGQVYSCANPPSCRQPGACLGDGGCSFALAQDTTPCDGGWGTCQSGNCIAVPTSPFPYPATNFNPALYDAGGAVVINCAVVFNSSSGAVAPGWCGGPAPNLHLVTMDGGVQARLIAAQSLLVTSSGSLTLHGALPVIIASYSTGQTLIDGPILADTDGALDAGAGSRTRAQCGTQAGGDSVNPDHGGGGAGYGTPGAAGSLLGAAGDAGPTTPAPLLGGCPGGNCTSGAAGGFGGGAVQLSVAGELKLGSGGVSVSGGGGRGGITGGSPPRGAGGGGSGGVILLEGNRLDLTSSSFLTANGGAGGEGSDADESGGDGESGSVTGSGFAVSPNLANQGGNGGRGGTRGGAPQQGATQTTNGGSGGAVGRIFIRSHATPCVVNILPVQVSPQYQQWVTNNCPSSP